MAVFPAIGMPTRFSSGTWSLALIWTYMSTYIQPHAMIKFIKIALIDTGWLLDSMTARSIRNFLVAFRAFFFLCMVCILSFTYRFGQRATKINIFCSVLLILRHRYLQLLLVNGSHLN